MVQPGWEAVLLVDEADVFLVFALALLWFMRYLEDSKGSLDYRKPD